ncbi:EKC/KEOPS complex subunit TP53RK [Planococcus citri]|uniref:EKC/KEOPS complex subunit TP53RK n=1 Tax=Planococcus citri TaxID=170843 RepID=UPI0031F76BD6
MDENSAILFKQGAEGRIFKISYLGKPAILKERFKKKYRNEDLDNHLTKERIRAEAKSILKCKNAGIHTPAVYLVDFEKRRIIMEFIERSETVSDYIIKFSKNDSKSINEELTRLSNEIGRTIGKMHVNNIIHGDLTTSNILVKYLNDTEYHIVLIDFGLSHIKSSDEDKAVDLYVLERALTSKHNNVSWFFDNILSCYAKYDKLNEKVVRKLSEVRSRGRKRTMVG